ncbi:DUF6036 family nucleotidyltransferase [Spirosoma areae]
MDVENSDFLNFVASAERHGVEYILIGGLALLFNGIVRFTQDADVWLQPTNENRDRFMNVLLDAGYDEDDLTLLRAADFTQPQIIRISEGPIDVLTQVHFRLNYDECRQRAKVWTSEGDHKAYFLHINDLRETKILARRPKDLYDVLRIDELLEEKRRMEGGSDEQTVD